MVTLCKECSEEGIPQHKIHTQNWTIYFKVEPILCMVEECTSTRILESYFRAGLKIMSLLKEDASRKIAIMSDNFKPPKMVSLWSMAMEPATIAMEQGMKDNLEKT